MIQDIFPHKLHNEFRPDARPSADSPVLCFCGTQVLARETDPASASGGLIFPGWKDLPQDLSVVYAFCMDDTEYFINLDAARINPPVTDFPSLRSFSWVDIHRARHALANLWGMILFTGVHLHQWYTSSRYCGICGEKIVHDTKERAMVCPSCGKKHYPRLMPAVIVGVKNGDKLLVTKYRAGYNFYALIAGFTEIGETLEETVAREVMEETGLKVKNIRYYKSQPWGIVQDILAGFFCEVDGDDRIRMDANELKVAKWCPREEIELQPNEYSLTNEMMRIFRDHQEPNN